MIIGVSGYGGTGASAVIGVIKECENIQSYKYGSELQLLQQPDGILDLYHYLVEDQRRLSVSTMISRFKNGIRNGNLRNLQKDTNKEFYSISEQYVKSLIQVCWMGRSAFDPTDQKPFFDKPFFSFFNRGLNKIISKTAFNFIWPPDKERYFSVLGKDEFAVKTKKYISEVFAASGFESEKPILLEQLFPTNDPVRGMEFFGDCMSIVVDRDPRDLYILSNFIFSGKSRFMPNKKNVQEFITYFKGQRKSKTNDPRVFYLQFEDLVYKYEETTKKIIDWLNLQHKRPKVFFNPEDSINNTCLYKNFEKISSDISLIEKELAEYLYPFDEVNQGSNYKRDMKKAFILQPGDVKVK